MASLSLSLSLVSNKMHKITDSFSEFHHRWRQIEQTCGFSVTMTKGTVTYSTFSSSSLSRNWALDADNHSVTSNTSTTYSQRTWQGSRQALLKDPQMLSNREHHKPVSTFSQSLCSLHQSSLPAPKTASQDTYRQMSLPTEGLTRQSNHHSSSRGMHLTASAPGMLNSAGRTDMASYSLVDRDGAIRGDGDGSSGKEMMNVDTGAGEEKQRWWLGSKGPMEPLQAIREEDVQRNGCMTVAESEDSLERINSSSSDSLEEKDFSLSENRRHETKKKSLKSKLKSTLMGKNS